MFKKSGLIVCVVAAFAAVPAFAGGGAFAPPSPVPSLTPIDFPAPVPSATPLSGSNPIILASPGPSAVPPMVPGPVPSVFPSGIVPSSQGVPGAMPSSVPSGAPGMQKFQAFRACVKQIPKLGQTLKGLRGPQNRQARRQAISDYIAARRNCRVQAGLPVGPAPLLGQGSMGKPLVVPSPTPSSQGTSNPSSSGSSTSGAGI